MRVNVLQHAPNEGPGSIKSWADEHGDDFYVYHPKEFGHLPAASETDLLVILGSPHGPSDNLNWIHEERKLIKHLLNQHKPLLGICFGAQQIAVSLGAKCIDAPYKEVGWAPVYLQTDAIPGLPQKLTALHWHQQMFTLPVGSQLLFKSDLNTNQGFIYGKNVVGLQFHFEPETDNLREIAINDQAYPQTGNALKQDTAAIIAHGVPQENKQAMYNILNAITQRA